MQVEYDANGDALFIDFEDNMGELEKGGEYNRISIVNGEDGDRVRGSIIWPAREFLRKGFLDRLELVD